ncbi:hypothetical protein Fcan01_24935 [Folsomia candida]|uniref:Uncharacterized protein n=2 Tax=Folsomia candida TaxID=158441 RepID=A0A226D4R6_FOLCA|nr:hypothetical protein Fcan01_24935 [Folsomia candida]
MFSPKIFEIIPPAIKFSRSTQVFPLSWDVKKNLLAVTTSKTNKFFTLIFLAQSLVCMAHNLYQLHDKFLNLEIMEIFWLGFMVPSYYICFDGVLACYLKRDEMTTFFRWVTGFDTHLKQMPSRLSQKRKILHEKIAIFLVRYGIFATVIFTLLFILIYLMKPRSAQYLYSAWSNKGKSDMVNITAFLLFLTFEAFTKTIGIAQYFLLQTWFLFSVAYTTIGISTLSNSTNPVNKRLIYYRCLYLINYQHNNCYIVINSSMKYTFNGFCTITTGYVITRLFDRITLPEQIVIVDMFINITATTFLYLHISGMVSHKSGALCAKLATLVDLSLSPRNRKLRNREVKSIRPFGIRVGNIRSMSYNALNDYFVQSSSLFLTLLVTFPGLGVVAYIPGEGDVFVMQNIGDGGGIIRPSGNGKVCERLGDVRSNWGLTAPYEDRYKRTATITNFTGVELMTIHSFIREEGHLVNKIMYDDYPPFCFLVERELVVIPDSGYYIVKHERSNKCLTSYGSEVGILFWLDCGNVGQHWSFIQTE